MIDLACFGYISAASTLHVDRYPRPDSVARVYQIVPTVAADAPIVSLLSARLGMTCALIANNVGSDSDGNQLVQLLIRQGVQVNIKPCEGLVTPQMIVVCDTQGTKTIFTCMPRVVEQLLIADLGMLDTSRLVYVDFYTEISQASLRAIEHAAQRRLPVFVNLSSADLERKIAALQGLKVTIVQASLAIASELQPHVLAGRILRETSAEIGLVTLGPEGALAAQRWATHKTSAYNLGPVKTPHGAGAAFSAGFAFAYLNQWSLDKSLRFACALGSMNCCVSDGLGVFSPEEVLHVMDL